MISMTIWNMILQRNDMFVTVKISLGFVCFVVLLCIMQQKHAFVLMGESFSTYYFMTLLLQLFQNNGKYNCNCLYTKTLTLIEA